ncbi:MAG: hypothetical protein DLM59_14760 [Pseudonocardiales bacterium]|nr:MAG: hypothetical protein DLM59_14760 [Pseudonocardiales bacterium]
MESSFREATAEERVASVPLSHLSVELGHLYAEDISAGRDSLAAYFQRVAPWAAEARLTALARVSGQRRPRVSTCFLVDDYFARLGSPATIIPDLLETAADSGLHIDYLARESGCVDADQVPLAQLVEGHLVPDPAPNSTGLRPAVSEAGWLCNGQRSPVNGPSEAMRPVLPWAPAVENGRRRHSIFLDIELWDQTDGRRTWSCPFLAAVWQLLRLGLLRYQGRDVVVPKAWDHDTYPQEWDDLPAILQLSPRAAPFSAYRTFSILDGRFLPVEHAVRTILAQVAVEPLVLEQIVERSNGEGMRLAPEISSRIAYLFLPE